MVLSRLRRRFSSIFDGYYGRPKPTPINDGDGLLIFHHHRSWPESPPISIGDGDSLPIFDDYPSRLDSPPISTLDEDAPPRLIPIDDGDCGGRKEEKTSAMYRIENELREMNEEAPTHCSFGPLDADIFRWEGVVIGPANSCYEGGIFQLQIEFPSDYPLSPPFIKFITKIFHPNIGEDGTIYIDILNENWSSALTIEKLLLSICSILSNPCPQDSINNWLKFNETAKEWTKTYAMAN